MSAKLVHVANYVAILTFSIAAEACSQKSSYTATVGPEAELNHRLKALFSETKLLCFGRYALEVPIEAELIIGKVAIPDEVRIVPGGESARQTKIESDVTKILNESNTAEIDYNGPGPVDGSWQLRYYINGSAREMGLKFYASYITRGNFTFVLGDSILKGETEQNVLERQRKLATGLRLLNADETPGEPGFCFGVGFIPDRSYARQEITNAGIYLPSLPDVTFSVSSNKGAYADYTKAEFNEMRPELSLLGRVEQAKKKQGIRYPSRTELREGKRDVQHWHGEESLIRRADGVHDFEWAFIGTPMDIANPSEFHVHMYTKVKHNVVGAAESASLTDDESVALWDKLLSGLKFRVKVPGAPPGSYYFPPTQQPDGGSPK
jgi:hypothetical protein